MKQLSQAVQFDAALLNQYNQSLPRYTSYPPATELTTDFEVDAFRAAIAVGNYKKTPLSLYCHIPFCEIPCYFCGCNTVITQRKEVAQPYVGYLSRHIHQVASLVSPDRQVHQLHWGGWHTQLSRPESGGVPLESVESAFSVRCSGGSVD